MVVAGAADLRRPDARLIRLHEVGRNFRRSPSAMIGLCILALHLLIAASAPLIAPRSPTAIDAAAALQGPSRQHLFGTDRFGRDVFSRVLYGGRVALVIALLAATLAVTAGGLSGILLGYVGGVVDDVAMRLVDAALSIPGLLFLLLIVTVFGGGELVLLISLAVLYAPSVVRVARGAALDYVPRDFVAAARSRGETTLAIVWHELRPNVLDVLMVEFAMRASWMVLAISALSFLGFGVNPPTPDWGLMIAENRNVLLLAPWGTLFPMLGIGSLVIGLNLAADGLAKALGLDQIRGAPS